MHTPVLLIIFNRFDTTVQVIEKLREVGVRNLYIYCDGARDSKQGEKEELQYVQAKVLNEIDWLCDIKTNFRHINEGPRLAIGHAVSWFFDFEEEGIILEHDCVPNLSFFSFCEQMLAHYRLNERVLHISGDNFQFGPKYGDGSYYFSRISHIWGWATWKRAWKHYDVYLKSFPEFLNQHKIDSIIPYKSGRKYWLNILKACYEGKVESWDYQWNYVLFDLDGLSILPNVNLVSNVGFDSLALNTTNPFHKTANMTTKIMDNIVHPNGIRIEHKADKRTITRILNPSVFRYLTDKILDYLKGIMIW